MSSHYVRMYCIAISSQNKETSEVTVCLVIPFFLIIWPRQMYVLLFQSELLILALISHSKEKYIYVSVCARML